MPIKTLLRRAIPAGSLPIAWGLVLSVGTGLRIVVAIKVSSEVGVSWAAARATEVEELFARQLGYALYGLPAALLTAFQKYAASNVQLSLRTNLMKKIHSGLGGATSLPRVYEQAAPSSKGASSGGGAAATKPGVAATATTPRATTAPYSSRPLTSPSSVRRP